MEDREVFLKHIPADGTTIGNISLQRTLGWDDEKYQSMKDSLLSEGQLKKGQGKGGSLRWANIPVDGDDAPTNSEEETEEDIDFAADQEMFISYIPEDKGILNRNLQAFLEFDDAKFLRVKESLLKNGRILPSQGPGGAVRRRQENEEPWKPKEAPVKKESADLSQYGSDEEAFMAFVTDEGVHRKTLQARLGFDDEKFKEVKKILLLNGSIVPEDKGSVRNRKPDEDFWKPKEKKEQPQKEVVDLSQYESDEDAFLAFVPASEEIHSKSLNYKLGFDIEKFREVKRNLFLSGMIIPGNGKGMLKRRQPGEDCYQPPAEKEKEEPTENEDGTPREVADPVIYTCSVEKTATLILEALHGKYKRSVFYTTTTPDQYLEVKLKLNKYAGMTVPVRSEVLDSVRDFAEATFNASTAVKPSPEEGAVTPTPEKEAEAEK